MSTDVTLFLSQFCITYLTPLVLISCVLMLGCRRLEANVRLYILQSFTLGLLTVIVGISHNSPHSFGAAGLMLVGKCILIPMILFRVIRKVRMNPEVETYVSLPTSMLVGGGLILLSYSLIPSLPVAHGSLLNHVLKAGVAVVLAGLFMMITRKKAFSQIMGLYVMDNGIFCLTIATIFEMPLIIEMGIMFELLLGAMALGILVFRIQQSFDTVNISHLKNLRG